MPQWHCVSLWHYIWFQLVLNRNLFHNNIIAWCFSSWICQNCKNYGTKHIQLCVKLNIPAIFWVNLTKMLLKFANFRNFRNNKCIVLLSVSKYCLWALNHHMFVEENYNLKHIYEGFQKHCQIFIIAIIQKLHWPRSIDLLWVCSLLILSVLLKITT